MNWKKLEEKLIKEVVKVMNEIDYAKQSPTCQINAREVNYLMAKRIEHKKLNALLKIIQG